MHAGTDEEEGDDGDNLSRQRDTASGRGEVKEAGGKGGEHEGDPGEGAAENVNVWKGRQPALETSRDDEFEDFFSGLFP